MRERAVRDLDALLAGFTEGAFVVGADGRIALWNRGAERILGSTAREVLGQPCHEAFGGCDAGGRRLCHQQCQATGHAASGNGIASFELETRTRAGRPVWVSVSTLVAHEPKGGEATMHLFRDVTEAHELMARIRDRLAPAVATAVSGLTRREIEVLRFLAAGVSTRGCADRLDVARATNRNHVQSILAKLGVHSRLEAVAYAHRHRLI